MTFEQEGESNRHTSPQVEVTVYRIAQEALTNALRHANATSSAITLKYDDDRLTLTMTDNGRGFPVEETLRRVRAPGETDSRSGLGLRGMRERAGLIKAQLAVESSPEHGTTITLTVPLSAAPTKLSAAPVSNLALPATPGAPTPA